MTPERWRQIEELYHAARECAPKERPALLAQASAELRGKVEALLARDASGDKILDRPAAELLEESAVGRLEAGAQLGPYTIEASIGAGGMGEVYRAVDTRLGRKVAVKISAQQFTGRFEREARAISALNHPNICTLYDVGPNYLVMELVEGPTLAERIQQGAIPLDEALRIAQQIAAALEPAHEKGIVHRDLKPGNVKVKADGTVKVLDFGLAKLGGAPATQNDNSPTDTLSHTEAGVILGTAAYMSPEQAKGTAVDQRADIYAFGAVLYEMLTGKRLHQGATVTEILASVINEEPRWDQVPVQVRRLLRRCLEKDPQKRLRHIDDAMALLDEAPAAGITLAERKNRWLWPGVAVAGLAIIVGAATLWAPWRTQPSLQAVRFQILPSDKMTFPGAGGVPVVSPDGKWVVFPATGSDNVTSQWLRALDSVEARPLLGTQSSTDTPTQRFTPVFWSPDSRFVAFSLNGQLKKVDISGGTPQTICDVPGGTVVGGAWNRDGVIVFADNAGDGDILRRVSAAGGIPTPVTALDASRRETGHWRPRFLPDGSHFLYQRTSTEPEYAGIYVGSLDAKPKEQSLKPVLLSDRQGAYAAPIGGGPGRLLFLRDTTLYAQPFDPGRLELSGEAVPVAEQVGSYPLTNGGLFSISETGVLAYRMGASGSLQQLTWFDRQGKAIGTVGEKGAYSNLAISPDGTRVAVSQVDAQNVNSNLWVLDVSRGTSTRLTFNAGRDDFPVWSPDGKSVIFESNRGGHLDLYEKPSDGSGEERLLLKSEENKVPLSWSRDGRFLLYQSFNRNTRADLWILPLQGDHKPFVFLRTEFVECCGKFSPDGRWIAYQSDESGGYEIYVRPFAPNAGGESASGGKWLVSKGGGYFPSWRVDGKELFYTDVSNQLAVDVNTDTTFRLGVPRRLFASGVNYAHDAAADGNRFLYATPEGSNAQMPYMVVTNWQAALKK